jgi:hypothetical protein
MIVQNNIKEFVEEIKREQYLKGIPKILYKYRSWDTKYDKSLLLNQELYFASPDQFNDPFDCNIPLLFDEEELAPDKIFLDTLELARKMHPLKSEIELHEITFQHHKNNYLADKSYIQEIAKANRNEINNNFGVLSLTEDETNFLMWSHYTNSHTGYCIGFDTLKLHQKSSGMVEPVLYKKEVPKVPFFNDSKEVLIKFLRIFLYTKSYIWSYEKEFRISKNAFARKVFKFPHDCVKEIIFGCLMKEDVKMGLIKTIENLYPKANIYEMSLSKELFEIEKVQIR